MKKKLDPHARRAKWFMTLALAAGIAGMAGCARLGNAPPSSAGIADSAASAAAGPAPRAAASAP